jgi:hypothetical protein
VARLDRIRRRYVAKAIPSAKCSGRSKRTGKPCEQWAVVGTTVCYMHGGAAGQVRAKAEERVDLAVRLRQTPQVQPWDVLEQTAHIAYVLLLDAREAIVAGTYCGHTAWTARTSPRGWRNGGSASVKARHWTCSGCSHGYCGG